MQFISQYDSDNENSNFKQESQENTKNDEFKIEIPEMDFTNNLINIQSAPDVDVSHLLQEKNNQIVEKFESGYYIPEKANHLTGFMNYQIINDNDFNEQYYTYKAYGYAQDPTDFSNNKIVGDVESYNNPNMSRSVFSSTAKSQKDYRKKLKLTRMKYGDPGSGEFMGPWATYEGEEIFKNLSGELTEEQKQIMRQIEERRQKRKEEEKDTEMKILNFKPTSNLHLADETDYQGRSYLDPPNHLKNVDHTCFIPKKSIHTYTGHTKAVQVIRFFPKIGHYILSCSLDCKVKLWDVLSHRKCAMTYSGHTEGVRDINFSNDGRRFLSAGFDKVVQYWDTETGKVISSFPNKKIPFCVIFHPDDDKNEQFLVGTSAKKIIQYDGKSGKEIQSYDEHLGAINTLSFIDNNRKFVSTSDDKKIFIWEYGLPVVVKHISEPSMHSIPAVSLHPNGKYFVGQSLDNKVKYIMIIDCCL
jgi:pre-mRNA-processing factor 17